MEDLDFVAKIRTIQICSRPSGGKWHDRDKPAPDYLEPPKDGELGLLIPSLGKVSQAEMDYVVEGAKEKSRKRTATTIPVTFKKQGQRVTMEREG